MLSTVISNAGAFLLGKRLKQNIVHGDCILKELLIFIMGFILQMKLKKMRPCLNLRINDQFFYHPKLFFEIKYLVSCYRGNLI